jgi:hypothetical protein
MPRKKKIISVAMGTAQRIAEEVKVSKVTVFNALAYRTDSEIAKLIRSKALNEYGGVETTKLVF